MKELNVEKSFLSLSELLQAAPGKSSANSHAPFYKVSVPFPLAHPSTGLLMRISITRLRTLLILVRSQPGFSVRDPAGFQPRPWRGGRAEPSLLLISQQGLSCHTQTHTFTREQGEVSVRGPSNCRHKQAVLWGFIFLITKPMSNSRSFLPGNTLGSASHLRLLLLHK